MKKRLPLAVEASIGELRMTASELSHNYELQIQSKLSEAGTSISCRKGCSNCCYHPVLVTILEGLHIYQELVEQRLWTQTLKKALTAHSDQTLGLSLEIWLMSRIACPLLTDKGLCRTYGARPFACKVTYSIGDPEDCDPHRLSSNPDMLPKRFMLEVLAATETSILQRHQLTHIKVPLSTALLYAERIVKEELDLEDFQRILSKDVNVSQG